MYHPLESGEAQSKITLKWGNATTIAWSSSTTREGAIAATATIHMRPTAGRNC
ncbi:MAG TPA: hypothetical protein VFZ63_09625 [Jiangellaceae bacterium]